MIKIHPLALALTVIVSVAFATAVATPTFAAKKHQAFNGFSTITARSSYTTETVTGRVRTTRRGPEVQLPSGAWIPCAFGCAETLRTRTFDFWLWLHESRN